MKRLTSGKFLLYIIYLPALALCWAKSGMAQAPLPPKVDTWIADPIVLAEGLDTEDAYTYTVALSQALSIAGKSQQLVGQKALVLHCRQQDADKPDTDKQYQSARTLFFEGEELYLSFKFDEAAHRLTQASDMLTTLISDLDQAGLQLLYRARMTEGLAWFEAGHQDRASKTFAKLTLISPDYQPDPTLVSPKAREIYRSALAKSRTAGIGILEVRSVPEGASVKVDGLARGQTPITVSSLTPGPHIVRLQLAGYQVYDEFVDVWPPKVTSRTVELAPTAVLAAINRTRAAAMSGLPLDAIRQDLTFIAKQADTPTIVLLGLLPHPTQQNKILVTALCWQDGVRTSAAVISNLDTAARDMSALAPLLLSTQWPKVGWPQGSQRVQLDFSEALLGVPADWRWTQPESKSLFSQWWFWTGMSAAAIVVTATVVGLVVYNNQQP